MNPLEIYKLLPKLNCGECIARTCMSFAVSLGSNAGYLEQCTHIEPDKIVIIESMLKKGDWRDELIKSLMDEISVMDLDVIAADLGCCMKENRLVIRCIGQEYAISRDGAISPDTRNKWIKILLLHYVRNRGKGEFTGEWISFSELKGGFVKASTFLRDCEEPLRGLMDEDLKGTVVVLNRLGALMVDGYPSDNAWTFDLLPKIRTLILYRLSDNEFSSSLNILFDGITGKFLDVESLIFVCEGLIHTINNIMKYARSSGDKSHEKSY